MRRIQTGVIAVCLAAALLSGCAGSSAQSTASSTAASSAAASSISTTAVSANYDGGSGTQEDPYQINSVDSLLTFASNVNDGSQGGYAGVSFKLTSDLDLSGVEWAPIGNMNDMETHSTLFLGSFDGDGHTISNLNYTSDVYNCGAGLFGVSCGEVKNLTLENATVAVTEGTSMAIGGVVGYNMGSVDNVTLKGDSTITGNNCVGGIVGGNNNSITNCTVEGATVVVIGDNHFTDQIIQADVAECGGLVVGGSFGGSIDSCTASGTARGEFNMSPKVYASQFEQRVDTLFGYVYDFGTGNVCEIDITNSLLYGKLKYRELGYKVPKHLDRYIYMSESEYLMCRNNYGKEHLKKWILCKDGKTVKNDALEQVNAIKINTGDHNVLATLSEYNRKHDVLVQTYMYFNIINIIGVHSGKCVTVCNGEAGIGLDGIIRNRHGKDYYYDCKTYDDAFAVLCIKDKSNPSIQIYSYDGVPVKELVLAQPATSFDFDFARGWLYTYDAEEGVVARYKADIV